MPRPPILPTLDWAAILNASQDFDAWIAAADSGEQAERMRGAVDQQEFSPHHAAALAAVDRAVHVLAFAEDWCGDVVRHVPVLEKMARAQPHLDVRYCSRAEQPAAFARFLTNGGEAVPKFVFLSEDFVECGNWGPMPDPLRDVISRGKACGKVGAAREITSRMYAADPARTEVVAELLDRIAIAAARNP